VAELFVTHRSLGAAFGPVGLRAGSRSLSQISDRCRLLDTSRGIGTPRTPHWSKVEARRGGSVADLPERDHEQMLEPLAYHLVGEIGPVMDQRGNDLSRIGEEAQDVADRPEDLRVVIIIE
jgi:hypothetical protein